mmetsp:Transcript_7614/g.15885  ORF Transcript_7614/g.15885 Transcript_7614/m.15885 type:complete len:205 (+) Transcript_7614:19-633(+)
MGKPDSHASQLGDSSGRNFPVGSHRSATSLKASGSPQRSSAEVAKRPLPQCLRQPGQSRCNCAVKDASPEGKSMSGPGLTKSTRKKVTGLAPAGACVEERRKLSDFWVRMFNRHHARWRCAKTASKHCSAWAPGSNGKMTSTCRRPIMRFIVSSSQPAQVYLLPDGREEASPLASGECCQPSTHRTPESHAEECRPRKTVSAGT